MSEPGAASSGAAEIIATNAIRILNRRSWLALFVGALLGVVGILWLVYASREFIGQAVQAVDLRAQLSELTTRNRLLNDRIRELEGDSRQEPYLCVIDVNLNVRANLSPSVYMILEQANDSSNDCRIRLGGFDGASQAVLAGGPATASHLLSGYRVRVLERMNPVGSNYTVCRVLVARGKDIDGPRDSEQTCRSRRSGPIAN